MEGEGISDGSGAEGVVFLDGTKTSNSSMSLGGCYNHSVILYSFHIVTSENCNVIAITELSQRKK